MTRTASPSTGTDDKPASATQKRAANPLFVSMWSIQALLAHLPLLFPVDPASAPSPKSRYRSHYRYLGPQALLDALQHTTLSEFEIALYLIDFSPLERVLAQIYVPSHKGQTPFHPVSMFLCICLRRELNLSWRSLAQLLAGPHGSGWRTLFGFDESVTPSASGLRYFFNTVGPSVFDDLCPRYVQMLRHYGLCPEHSTYPNDPEDRGVTVTQDGMLHPALSRPSCQLATNNCYQPLAPIGPDSTQTTPELEANHNDGPDQLGQAQPGRACRARERGLPGCACDSPACQERCQRASVLDPEARFIHYEGHNKDAGTVSASRSSPQAKTKGTDVFGYRSVAERLLDDRFAVAWTVRSSLYPANTDERTIFIDRLANLQKALPGLRIGEWIDDAGVGYDHCLEAIWELGALRMVDIRADASDKDPEACLRRGYEGHGHPLCPHGYRLHSNGYDYAERRRKWVCRQACRKEPPWRVGGATKEGETIRAVEGCPYLDGSSTGFVVNVGRSLPDGSTRLAREIPYGSEEWGKRYGRRNLSESRNGQIEGMGLKRMHSYGRLRNGKEMQVADFIINLRTLGRLVREATNLSDN